MLEKLVVIHIIDKRGWTLAVSNLVSIKEPHFKKSSTGPQKEFASNAFQVVGIKVFIGDKKVAYSEWKIKVSTGSAKRVSLSNCCNSNVKRIEILKP